MLAAMNSATEIPRTLSPVVGAVSAQAAALQELEEVVSALEKQLMPIRVMPPEVPSSGTSGPQGPVPDPRSELRLQIEANTYDISRLHNRLLRLRDQIEL